MDLCEIDGTGQPGAGAATADVHGVVTGTGAGRAQAGAEKCAHGPADPRISGYYDVTEGPRDARVPSDPGTPTPGGGEETRFMLPMLLLCFRPQASVRRAHPVVATAACRHTMVSQNRMILRWTLTRSGAPGIIRCRGHIARGRGPGKARLPAEMALPPSLLPPACPRPSHDTDSNMYRSHIDPAHTSWHGKCLECSPRPARLVPTARGSIGRRVFGQVRHNRDPRRRIPGDVR